MFVFSLMILAFSNPEVPVSNLKIMMITTPNSAELEVFIRNPFDVSLQVEELVIDIPGFLEFTFDKGMFMANLAHLSRVEMEISEEGERLRMEFQDEFRFLGAKKEMSLELGQFIGAPEMARELEAEVRMKASKGAWRPVPFRLAYAEPMLHSQSQNTAYQIKQKTFAADSYGGGGTRAPDCDTIIDSIVLPCSPYAITYCPTSGCSSNQSCQRGGSGEYISYNFSRSVYIPGCSCFYSKK